MALPYQSFADSKPFKFLVGETGKPVYIHASLAAHQSTTLATLINGGMVEAKREYAVLDDVDEETFIRFTQFAYTGDYAVAEPDVILSQLDIEVENGVENGKYDPITKPFFDFPDAAESTPEYPPPEDIPADEAPAQEPEPELEPEPAPADPDYLWGNFGSTTNRKKSKKNKGFAWAEDRGDEDIAQPAGPGLSARLVPSSKRERLWDAFKAKAYAKYPDAWHPSANEDHCEDYTPVFLCHAKLYTFSDKYSIEPLSELVLQKLRLNLSKFKLHSQRIGDIVELLKYAYEHTTDYEEGIDRLRNLIADYVVCHIEKIVGFSDFTKLLQEIGDVAKDLLPKLMQRLD